jgi:hypothetical protein
MILKARNSMHVGGLKAADNFDYEHLFCRSLKPFRMHFAAKNCLRIIVSIAVLTNAILG